jgi:hypothetical protein
MVAMWTDAQRLARKMLFEVDRNDRTATIADIGNRAAPGTTRSALAKWARFDAADDTSRHRALR